MTGSGEGCIQRIVSGRICERGLEWRGLRMFASTGDPPEEPLRSEWRGWETKADSYFGSGLDSVIEPGKDRTT